MLTIAVLHTLPRLVPYLVGSVLDCFRPVIDFAVPPSHPDLHTSAVAAFMMSTCALQHYALHFFAEVCLAPLRSCPQERRPCDVQQPCNGTWC